MARVFTDDSGAMAVSCRRLQKAHPIRERSVCRGCWDCKGEMGLGMRGFGRRGRGGAAKKHRQTLLKPSFRGHRHERTIGNSGNQERQARRNHS
jgi:hypothetical protein